MATMDYESFKAFSLRLAGEKEYQVKLAEAYKPVQDQINKLLQGINSKLIHLTSENTTLKSEVTTMNKRLKTAEEKIESLEKKITRQAKQERGKNLRLTNLEENDPENTTETVQEFIKETFKIIPQATDITAERVGLKKVGETKPRPILIKFNNAWLRRDILRNKKMLKDLEKKVYISEDLTPENATIFFKARQLKKVNKIVATYPRNGSIMVKVFDNSIPEELTPTLLERLSNPPQPSNSNMGSESSDESFLSQRMKLRDADSASSMDDQPST